jgi:hypothetical protein
MATCLTFVFLALVEFAVVNVLNNDTKQTGNDTRTQPSTTKCRKSVKVSPEVQSLEEEELVN